MAKRKSKSTDQSFFLDPEAVDAGDRPVKAKGKKKKVAEASTNEGWFEACNEGRHNLCPFHVYVQWVEKPGWSTCNCPCGHPGRTKDYL